MDNRLIITDDVTIELSSDLQIHVLIKKNAIVTLIERDHEHNVSYQRIIEVEESAHVTYFYEQAHDCTVDHTFIIGQFAQVTMQMFIHSSVRQQCIAQINSNAEFNCKGLYILNNKQVVEFVSKQQHCQQNSASSVYFNGVLFDQSQASYKGTIAIDQIATGSTAQQYNKNVMIGSLCKATSIPSLEVLTDNVSCKHGSAMSTIMPEDLFYLQSRGLQKSSAQQLCIEAFCNQVIDSQLWTDKCTEIIKESM